jgi:hypothetical protein
MEVWFVTRALCLSAIPSDKGIEIRSSIELLFTMESEIATSPHSATPAAVFHFTDLKLYHNVVFSWPQYGISV